MSAPENTQNEPISELVAAENSLFMEDGSNEVPPVDIVAFNELRSCADLFRMHARGQLDIQPDYQRNFVWNNALQARFLDSLVKQLPIPSLCISLDYRNDRRQVVDGLQRISTIVRFLSDERWKLPALPDIHPDLSGKTVGEIKSRSGHLVDRIENTTIPVTVLRCDLSLRNHQEYLFTIFHRLNTGGVSLTNQEIRNCIYSGPLNDFLKDFVEASPYKDLFPQKKSPYRFIEEEKVLRVLALSEDEPKYVAPLSKYLNAYMSKHRNIEGAQLDLVRSKLKDTYSLFSLISAQFGLSNVGATIIEAALVGIFSNVARLNQSSEGIGRKWLNLRDHPSLQAERLMEGLSNTDSVNDRLEAAKRIFSA